KIAYERPSGFRFDENVVRFDVTVDDAAAMRVRQCPRDLFQQARGDSGRQRSSRSEPLAERFAFDVRHGEEDESACLADAIDRSDVRMRERRGQASFAKKTLADVGAFSERFRKDLDGDEAIELHLAGEVHDTHPASTQLALDRVVASQRPLEIDEFAV